MTMVENVLVKLSLDSKQARIQAKAFMGVMRNIQRLSANSFYVAKRVTQQFSQMSAKTKALYQTGAIPNINAELKTLGSKTLPKVTNASDVMNAAVGRATEKFEAMKKPQRELTRKQNLMNKQMNGGAAGLIRNAELMQDIENKHQGFGKALLMNSGTLKKFNDGGGESSNRLARVGNKLRMAITGLKGFKMEMLGIMFFGMAMQRMFTGLLKPSAQLVGLFDLWKTTLQVLFLPLSLLLMNFLMPLFIWLMSLDDGTKLFIGKLVLLGAAIGTILFIVGTLALGIGSMIVAFSSIFNIIDKLIPDVKVFGVGLSSIIEAGLGLALIEFLFGAVGDAAKKVFKRMTGIGVMKDLFEKLGIEIDDSLSIWDNFKLLFGAGWDKIKEKLNLDSEEGFIGTNIKKIEDAFKNMKDSVSEELSNIGLSGEDGLIAQLGDMGAKMGEIMPTVDSLAKSLGIIADVLQRIIDKIDKMRNREDFVSTIFDTARVVGGGPQGMAIDYYQPPVTHGDFLMRPGQRAVSFSPDDTVVGFKGNSPMGATINQTLNINARSDQDVRRVVDLANASLLSKLQRNMG